MQTADDSDVVMILLQRMPLEDAARWLAAPNPDLNGATPEQAIEAGRKADVLRLLDEMRSSSAAA